MVLEKIMVVIVYIFGISGMYDVCYYEADMPRGVALLFALVWPMGLPILGVLLLISRVERRHF